MAEAVHNRTTEAEGTAARAGAAEDVAADVSDVRHLRQWHAQKQQAFMGHTVFLLPLTVEGGLDRSPP